MLAMLEPQTKLMAMVLTRNAMGASAVAKMLLCGPAGDIALQDASGPAVAGQPAKDASPQSLMRMMMAEKGFKVQVCAIYLPGDGVDAYPLPEGVTVEAPSAMGAHITRGGHLWPPFTLSGKAADLPADYIPGRIVMSRRAPPAPSIMPTSVAAPLSRSTV